jgi:hypothetical protein
MKLGSPEAMRWEPAMDPPSEDCWHERRCTVLGRVVCADCGEVWAPRHPADEAQLELELARE